MEVGIGASALSTFVELGKSATELAAAKNIELAISHKKTYVFGELLHLPNVQALQQTQYTKHLALLQLFAYGTYTEYLANKLAFPELTELQVQKLKQLTIVTLAVENKKLKYELLMKTLEIENVRSLEDLVIECVYAGILEAKLDQKQKEVLVFSAIGRDLPPGGLTGIIAKLGKWSKSANMLIENMSKQIEDANMEYSLEQKTKEQFKVDLAQKKKEINEKLSKDKARGGGSGSSSGMLDHRNRMNLNSTHGVLSGDACSALYYGANNNDRGGGEPYRDF